VARTTGMATIFEVTMVSPSSADFFTGDAVTLVEDMLPARYLMTEIELGSVETIGGVGYAGAGVIQSRESEIYPITVRWNKIAKTTFIAHRRVGQKGTS